MSLIYLSGMKNSTVLSNNKPYKDNELDMGIHSSR